MVVFPNLSDNMKRRNFITALVTLLTPLFTPRRARALTIDEWSLTPGQAGEASGIVPPSMPAGIVQPSPVSTTKKALQWACMCLRRGGHWTIGAIDFIRASIGQVRHHLVTVHGHSYADLAGMSKEQLGNMHDAHHEGRSYGRFHFPPTPPNGLNRMPQSIMDSLPRASSCPGGVCPIRRRA